MSYFKKFSTAKAHAASLTTAAQAYEVGFNFELNMYYARPQF